jgi:alanyl-tRNA synthetase
MDMATAIEKGADAFFDEKYGETVRTIRVADYSFELCGGTHCRASGQIGSFVITGERSIGSGMRRIEALTGAAADAYLRARSDALEATAATLGAQNTDAVPERIAALQAELKELKRRLREGGGAAGALPKPGDLVAAAETIGDTRVVAHGGPYESIDALKAAAKTISGVLGDGVVALALDAEEPQVFVTVSADLVARGLSAGDLVRAAVVPLEGKGGGRPEMAQGKGARREGVPDALDAIRTAIREALGNGA